MSTRRTVGYLDRGLVRRRRYSALRARPEPPSGGTAFVGSELGPIDWLHYYEHHHTLSQAQGMELYVTCTC